LTPPRLARILNEVVNSQPEISAVFAALADPIRRQILARLSTIGEGPVTELAKPFPVSLPAVSRHLRVLEEARLIDRRVTGRVHVIRFRAAGLKAAQDWMTRCAAAWDHSFDALDALLQTEMHKGKEIKSEPGPKRKRQ
jgi:DNA-binding transcriptional ArsR family regulator